MASLAEVARELPLQLMEKIALTLQAVYLGSSAITPGLGPLQTVSPPRICRTIPAMTLPGRARQQLDKETLQLKLLQLWKRIKLKRQERSLHLGSEATEIREKQREGCSPPCMRMTKTTHSLIIVEITRMITIMRTIMSIMMKLLRRRSQMSLGQGTCHKYQATRLPREASWEAEWCRYQSACQATMKAK